MYISGVSRISASRVLKVRPHTKNGGGGGAVHFRSDIRKVRGGGRSDMKSGGGGAVHFRSDIRKVGGGIRFRSDMKSGGGGGGGGQSTSGPIYEKWRADTFVWHKENT